MRFESGMLGSFVNSFDIWASGTPKIEIHGEKGTLIVPDPNMFEGPIQLMRYRNKNKEWATLPQFVEYANYGRGIGVADMVKSIEKGVPHKASAEMAYHVTDVILTMNEAAEAKRELKVNSTVAKPGGLFDDQDPILWA